MLRWNFDRGTYVPGSQGACSIWLENTGDTVLYAERVWLRFDWQLEKAFSQQCEMQIPPRNNFFLTSVAFDIPKTKAGTILYSMGVDLHEYDGKYGIWNKLPTWWSDRKFFIKSIPLPYFKAFVSRGIKPEDRLISDPIVEMIKEWGFNTITVGIEKTADPSLIDEVAKNEIRTSDCLIAIATGRYVDALTGLWRTLEWLHGETGIGFGLDKPLLLLKSDDVAVGGLPGYLADKGRQPVLSFNPLDLSSLQPHIDAVMPSFREWISSKKSQEFWNTIAGAGLLLLIGGIFGFAIGSSKK
jgi:hypothetical protein